METWVLIMILTVSGNQGQAIHSQEFLGKDTCEIAKSVISQNMQVYDGYTHHYSVCVLKSAKLN